MLAGRILFRIANLGHKEVGNLVQRLWDGLVMDNHILKDHKAKRRAVSSYTSFTITYFFNKRFQLSLLDVALSNMLI